MKYQIDQSGKIEQTNWPTIVATSNGKSKTIKITAVEKRKLITTLIRLHRPHKTYYYQIFAALIFFLIKTENVQSVSIDIEYPGHTSSIKEILIQLFVKNHIPIPNISFELVGKKCKAHLIALDTFQGNRKTNMLVTASQIVKVLTTKKGWRSQSSRENP